MSSSKGSIILTGANGGLGSAIVGNILQNSDLASNYMSLYTVRKASTASQLKQVLGSAPASHEHEIVDLDLSSLASVRKTAAEINGRVAKGELPRIRALILNAGYQDHLEINMTGDGFETTWQVNFLANMLLSLLLLQSMDKENGRILIVGSWSHDINDERNLTGGNIPYNGYTTLFPGVETLAKGEWSTPQDEGGWYTGFRRYGASKLCAVMLMHELGDRLAKDPELSNISVIGLDPGAMGSDLVRRGSFLLRVIQVKLLMPVAASIAVRFKPNGAIRPLWKSADDVMQACFDREVPKGKALYLNGTDEWETGVEARDAANRRSVWEYGLKAADVKQGDTVLVNWQ